ncbi:MAG: M16 family metallopeptidase [Thermoanaerobaculia bacterium]
MKSRTAIVAAAFLALALATNVLAAPAAPPAKSLAAGIDIPYEKIVLPNGLTLLVHEDHKAPIVAVNVWYHVGSKNEKKGKSGFAHLFEHLMFNGSENFNDDYFQALERVGATDLNGTTNYDRTNYFQNVPTSALDLTLWMESERMGHLLGAIDQARLDEQRGVVQNEKRQWDNEPYTVSEELITRATWPAHHPYSWTVIGLMEDLQAASLPDVHEWFRNYYGAANAVIVLAGDIDVKTAKEKVEKYFGDIPAGPPVARHEAWVAERTTSQRQRVDDRVPQARLYRVWNTPGWGKADSAEVDLITDLLTAGKTSRLYKRLVYDAQIATDVRAYIDEREIASQLVIEATARPGDDLTKIEKAIDEEIARFLASGPTQQELDRVRTQWIARFVRGSERIGGFGGKSDILAASEVYGGSPDAWKATLSAIEGATLKSVTAAAKRWLSQGDYNLEVHPFPEYSTLPAVADRKKAPEVGAAPAPAFPRMERAKLANGLTLLVAERHTVPVVNFNLLVDAGYAADQFATPGTGSLAMTMLDEGTKTRNALQISEELAALGAQLNPGSDLDTSYVRLTALKANLDPSLDVFADVVLNPSFPEADFGRLQKQQLAQIQQEKAQPIGMAMRVLPQYLYGANHAYGTPLTGSGTSESVSKMTRADLAKYHATWFKPNNATLIVVGDTTMAEVRPKVEMLFAKWKGGDVPVKNIGRVEQPKGQVFILDKPGAVQSLILAGHLAPPKNNPNEIAIETLNNILGGAFISRINMNLREDKHWSYGAATFSWGARGQRPFVAYAPVQSDKTKEAMQEIAKELRQIAKEKPVTADELAMAKGNQTLALPGTWETAGAVSGAIAELVRFGLPDDYHATYAGKVHALDLKAVNGASTELLHPDNLVWVVVGDRAKIESGLKELGYGPVVPIDSDGKPLK